MMFARLACLTALLALLLGIEWESAFGQTAPDAGEETFNKEAGYLAVAAPFLAAHCADCHGEESPEAGLSLAADPPAVEAIADRAVWLRVRAALAKRQMPPPDRTQPSSEERRAMLEWIDWAALGVDPGNPDPGRVTVRRLNRGEYRRTLRDLTGVDLPQVEDFPVDASGHGFDTIGDALAVSPLLAEKLLAAAEEAAQRAIETPEDGRSQLRRYPLDLLEIGYNARQQGNGWVSLNSVEEDDLALKLWTPASGEYAVRVSAYGEPKSSRTMELTFLDGDRPLVVLPVAAKPAKVHEARLKLARGEHRLRVAVRRFKEGLSAEEAAKFASGTNQQGAVFVEWLEVEGPLVREASDPSDFQSRLMAPLANLDGETPFQVQAVAILEPYLERAFRRPPTPDEVDRLARLAQDRRQAGASVEEAIRAAVSASLASPQFLFRLESAPHSALGEGGKEGPPEEQKDLSEPLDDYSLASRLSYFLWSSMPDEELFRLAKAGVLRSRLHEQVRRMLRDERSQALVENFAGQWLELRNLDQAAPDRELFPGFDEPLRQAMRRETELFFAHLIAEDRPLGELLTADYTFVNERLAKHYGLKNVQGEEFRRVNLSGAGRIGLLTQASILTLSSNPNRTSPVKRGKWVLENLLGAPPPAPPPDVPALEKTPSQEGLSLRARLEVHRQNAVCASCHQRMDAIGFGLEHFDAIGAWRTSDRGAAIDASGELGGGKTFRGAEELAQMLADGEREAFLRCVAEKLLTYALGRGLEYYDGCSVDAIVAACVSGEERFSALVLGVVDSPPFQRRRVALEP